MAFNFNKLTLKSQESLQTAQEIATNYSNQVIEPEHMLAALVQDKEGISSSILYKLGVNKDLLQIRIGEMLESLPKVSGAGVGNINISRDLSEVLENASKETSS